MTSDPIHALDMRSNIIDRLDGDDGNGDEEEEEEEVRWQGRTSTVQLVKSVNDDDGQVMKKKKQMMMSTLSSIRALSIRCRRRRH